MPGSEEKKKWQIWHLADLGYPWQTIALNVGLLILFVAVFLGGSASPAAEDATRWPALAVVIVYALHSLAIPVMLLLRVLNATTKGRVQRSLRRGRNLGRVAYAFLAMIMMYGLLQAIYIDFDNDAYIGIPADAPRHMRLRRGMFLSTETATRTAIGSGAIIAAPDAEGAFILLGINSVHAYIFEHLVFALVVAMIAVSALDRVGGVGQRSL